ncbi:octanoyltransferase [Candidatus Aerophobetes bacterium]|uniref:Octanoyltransferase n=1 Tax=Aerophobetes bacterium TaxID=2030807 RepID=A0A662D4V1_UNCAE|nr:MAG: octanoyltransferase [Candidatus Aerophobetes bacterium]
MLKKLDVLDLGLRNYKEVWDLQRKLVYKRISDDIPDSLILVEHFPVITLGRQAKKEEVLVSKSYLSERRISLFQIERGGKATFHGPGQLVAYPIINLALNEKDLHKYLRNLEETVIRLLKKVGVKGERKERYTGVWVKDKKIASIGIAIKKWVTYHGLALNVNVDLSYFSLIFPCGMDNKKVTSLEEIFSYPVEMDKVKKLFIKSFCEVFNYS